jgi:hypothetical protein
MKIFQRFRESIIVCFITNAKDNCRREPRAVSISLSLPASPGNSDVQGPAQSPQAPAAEP